MAKRSFRIDTGILHLPVLDVDDDPTREWYVKITDADTNQQFAEFYIALTPGKPEFYCPLYLHALVGKTVVLSCYDENVPDNLFDGILSGGDMEACPELYPDLYWEKERPRIHFSSRRGWLNDPNGLVYVDGTFHMSYQHNPYAPLHGGVNIGWGLAVSPDGVHFKEYPDVIRPWDHETHCASGSAIVDKHNISGLGPDTVLATYTALGSWLHKGRQTDVYTRGQMLEYSTDGGFTFQKFSQQPIIPVEYRSTWRDPKILQIDENSLCIAVYETCEGRNCVSFYSSRDCINWRFESRTMDLYECPDLFELPVMETGEKLWILYGGNGMYRVGRFENYAFVQIGESQHLDYGSEIYAGQTWNSHPDSDCRYHIAWVRNEPSARVIVRQQGTAFAQFMSLVCRFELHATPQGYRLFRQPIAALDSLRRLAPQAVNCSLGGIAAPETLRIPLENPGDAVFTVDAQRPLRVTVDGRGFVYEPDEHRLCFTSGKCYILTAPRQFTLRVVTDVHSVEYFICDEISATYLSGSEKKILQLQGEAARIQGEIWSMESIWQSSEGK